MKLSLVGADFGAEEWKRENRERNVYPAPNDGREWILLDDAAAMAGVQPKALAKRARKQDWTRTCRHGAKVWLLKKDVDFSLKFIRRREDWRKRRRPKHWIPEIGDLTGMEEEQIKRTFLTTAQAAAYMGVSERTIRRWVTMGRIPVYLTRKKGTGGRNWYSLTNLQNYKEDEERNKWLAVREKGKETMRQGISSLEHYQMKYRRRVYSGVPAGWIPVRETAERLGVSMRTVLRLRQRARLHGEQWVGKWDKMRPWFFHEDLVEEYRVSDHYQKTQLQGKNANRAVVGKPAFDPSGDTVPWARVISNTSELSFSYTKEELHPNQGERICCVPNPPLW